MQAQSGTPQGCGGNSRQANINRFGLHVQAVASHAGVRAAGAEEFVAPGRAVSADHVDLSRGIMERSGEVVEQIKKARIEMVHVSGSMIAEKVVEFVERLRYVGIAAAVNDVELLPGVRVIEAQAVF